VTKETGRQAELSPAKREQILQGAHPVFSELGYERASVDAIATRAGVSKATIYNHFHDKKALFVATFGVDSEGLRDRFLSLLETPSGDLEKDLYEIGEQFVRMVCAPAHVHRFRLVCAEVERFPELGKMLFENSLAVGRDRMASFFARAAAEGQLVVDDPVDAARDFASLCVQELSLELNLGLIDQVSDALIRTHLKRGIGTFLRAYRRA
jgi:AcrR family transcriptional regulator